MLKVQLEYFSKAYHSLHQPTIGIFISALFYLCVAIPWEAERGTDNACMCLRQPVLLGVAHRMLGVVLAVNCSRVRKNGIQVNFLPDVQ